MYGITDENWLEYAKTYEYEIRHKYVKELCNSRNIVTMRVLLQFFLKHLEKLEQEEKTPEEIPSHSSPNPPTPIKK